MCLQNSSHKSNDKKVGGCTKFESSTLKKNIIYSLHYLQSQGHLVHLHPLIS